MTYFVSNILVALGANLPEPEGNPASNLVRAVREMAQSGLTIRAVSRFYETPCFPADAGPDYVNAAVRAETTLAPGALLHNLHEIETRMGRERDTRWGMRTLDLDLLAVGDDVLPDAATFSTWKELALDEQMLRAPDQLILPHPRLAERAFVLVPLCDIAPEWQHPVTRQSVQQMADALDPAETALVRPL